MTSLGYKLREMAGFPYLDLDVPIALAYARQNERDSFTVLFQTDDSFARIIRATREPMISRICLCWWRDSLEAMASGQRFPPEPLLMSIENAGFESDVVSRMSRISEGWSVLLDDFPLSDDVLNQFAQQRGGALFGAAAQVSGADVAQAEVLGEAWALSNFARQCSDSLTATRAANLAQGRFDVMMAPAQPRAFLPFMILGHLAKRDLRGISGRRVAPGSPRRMLRAARFALLRK